MNIIKTEIKDLLIIEPKVFGDSRGYFFEAWNKTLFEQNGIDFMPLQQNESKSCYGVIRGLHYQINPYAQAKLVRVTSGEVLDVAVDLRKNSATYGKYFSIILSSQNKRQFFIPRGFAHGFAVLSDEAVFEYMCDNVYSPESERGIIYNDSLLNIDWKIPVEKAIVSEKDTKHPDFIKHTDNF